MKKALSLSCPFFFGLSFALPFPFVTALELVLGCVVLLLAMDELPLAAGADALVLAVEEAAVESERDGEAEAASSSAAKASLSEG